MKKNKFLKKSITQTSSILASTDHTLSQNQSTTFINADRSLLIQKLQNLEATLNATKRQRQQLQYKQDHLYEILFARKRKLISMNQKIMVIDQSSKIQKKTQNSAISCTLNDNVVQKYTVKQMQSISSKKTTNNITKCCTAFITPIRRSPQRLKSYKQKDKTNQNLKNPFRLLKSQTSSFLKRSSKQECQTNNYFNENLQNNYSKSIFSSIDEIWDQSRQENPVKYPKRSLKTQGYD